MENVEKVIDLLQKRERVRDHKFRIEEEKQMIEYGNVMNTLQTIKDERNSHKENISKNLRRLTAHKYSIYELIHNTECIIGLPISHEYHRQAVMFLSEGVDFINKLQNVYKDFDSSDVEQNINSTHLIHNITSCTNSIGNEIYKIKSLITEVKTLQDNTDVLQQYYIDNDEVVDA